MFDFFQLTLDKCYLVKAYSKQASEMVECEKTQQQDLVKDNIEWKTPYTNDIKNIDDPNSDEEVVQTKDENDQNDQIINNDNNNINNNQEETDDFLLIGSWFDDQLNSESVTNGTITESTALTTNANTNAIVDSNMTDVTAAVGVTGESQFGGADSSNDTQVLDTTFELDRPEGYSSKVCCFFFLLKIRNSGFEYT